MTTREKILDATLELAAENGLGSVSLSQIANKVGIQKQSLYNHFASKDAIMEGLYEYLRQRAREKVNTAPIDYGKLVKGREPEEVLLQTVHAYMTMNQDPDMERFYRFILSERTVHREAARIMVAETQKMILATKQLFYAMQAHHVMEFANVDMAAFAFAMAVHSMIDYQGDLNMAREEGNVDTLLEEYVADFCAVRRK